MSDSSTPATQNEGECPQVQRLSRKTKVNVAKCHACHAKLFVREMVCDKVVCDKVVCDKVVCDKVVCDKVVCVCVTKWCVTKLCVCDKVVCDKVVCDKDGVCV